MGDHVKKNGPSLRETWSLIRETGRCPLFLDFFTLFFLNCAKLYRIQPNFFVRGRRGSTNLKEARLFLVRGQDAQETYLKELKADPANLRPSGVFILAKRGKGRDQCNLKARPLFHFIRNKPLKQLNQDLCTAITLFYSAILNDNFTMKKSKTEKAKMMTFLARYSKIPKCEIRHNLRPVIFLKTACWNLHI